MTTISVVPQNLNMIIYAGDSFNIRLDFRSQAGNLLDMTGTYVAEIRGGLPDPITTFNVVTDEMANGTIFLSLDSDQTRLLQISTSASTMNYDLQYQGATLATQTLLFGEISIVSDVSV